jgi:hypothetical protein
VNSGTPVFHTVELMGETFTLRKPIPVVPLQTMVKAQGEGDFLGMLEQITKLIVEIQRAKFTELLESAGWADMHDLGTQLVAAVNLERHEASRDT